MNGRPNKNSYTLLRMLNWATTSIGANALHDKSVTTKQRYT